jgi:hypothetical protein
VLDAASIATGELSRFGESGQHYSNQILSHAGAMAHYGFPQDKQHARETQFRPQLDEKGNPVTKRVGNTQFPMLQEVFTDNGDRTGGTKYGEAVRDPSERESFEMRTGGFTPKDLEERRIRLSNQAQEAGKALSVEGSKSLSSAQRVQRLKELQWLSDEITHVKRLQGDKDYQGPQYDDHIKTAEEIQRLDDENKGLTEKIKSQKLNPGSDIHQQIEANQDKIRQLSGTFKNGHGEKERSTTPGKYKTKSGVSYSIEP